MFLARDRGVNGRGEEAAKIVICDVTWGNDTSDEAEELEWCDVGSECSGRVWTVDDGGEEEVDVYEEWDEG